MIKKKIIFGICIILILTMSMNVFGVLHYNKFTSESSNLPNVYVPYNYNVDSPNMVNWNGTEFHYGNFFIEDIEDELHHLNVDLENLDELYANVFLTPLIVKTFSNSTGDYINITADQNETSITVNLATETSANNYRLNYTNIILPLTNGTNETPLLNRVYIYLDDGVPTWDVSLSEVEIKHSMVARVLLGDSGSSPYIASLKEDGQLGFLKRVQRRFRKEGLLYEERYDFNVTKDSIQIGGGNHINGIYDIETTNIVNSSISFYLIHEDGTYHWYDSISDILKYSDGNTIGTNKYYNVIWGLTPYDGYVNLLAVIQEEPSVEYTSMTDAYEDSSNTLKIFPSDNFAKLNFLPIARTIVNSQSNEFQVLPDGSYSIDYRGGIAGGISSGGGLPEVDPIWSIEKTDYWKNDGTSTATGNWDIGNNNFTTSGEISSNSLTINLSTIYDWNDVNFSTEPKGNNGEIQFNDEGEFGSDSNFQFNKSSKDLTVGINGVSGGDISFFGPKFFGLYKTMFFDSSTSAFGACLTINDARTDITGYGAVGLGIYTKAQGSGAFSVSGTATANQAIAIGWQSNAEDRSSIAIGDNAESKSVEGIAIGSRAEAGKGNSIDIQSISIGVDSSSSELYSIAIGKNSNAHGNYTLTIGAGQNYPPYLFENSKNSSILLGFNFGTQQNLLEAENNKGVRVGDNSGESITMDGDDLYVKDNTEIGGYLVMGSNTEDGLSEGDINASTIYYDTLQAKSPIVMCSNNDCKVTVPSLQEEYYITKDDNYNIIFVAKNEELPEIVIEKFNKLKAKKEEYEKRVQCHKKGDYYEFVNGFCKINQQNKCESNHNNYWTGKKCIENPYFACESKKDSTYNFETKSCEYNEEKDCNSKEFYWDPIKKTCVEPQTPLKTIEELKEECIQTSKCMWDSKQIQCIELRIFLAEPYKQPLGSHDAYNDGDIIIWNTQYYESVLKGNVWNPTQYPLGWEVINPEVCG